MAVSITVVYTRTDPTTIPHPQAYQLDVVVSASTNVSKNIFVFRKKVPSVTDVQSNQSQEDFISIADPVDLEEFPDNAPDMTNEIPYFRLDHVSLRFRCAEDLDNTQTLIEQDIQHLVDSLNILGSTGLQVETTYA